jgi:hypothetical protein
VKKININSIEVEVNPDDKIRLIYIPEQRQVLEAGQEYELVISQLKIKPAFGFKFEKEDS